MCFFIYLNIGVSIISSSYKLLMVTLKTYIPFATHATPHPQEGLFDMSEPTSLS